MRKAKQQETSQEFTPAVPVTLAQQGFFDAMRYNSIVLCKGYAGTGKTMLALSHAIKEFRAGNIKQILYTRPIVQFSSLQSLGYLPGTSEEKLEPLLWPIKDNISKLCSAGLASYMLSKRLIQPIALQDLRGRSLAETILIVDEAQSLEAKDLELCLTRIDDNSQIIALADPRQKDSWSKYESGFSLFAKKLAKLEGIAYCELGLEDVQRGNGLAGLVQECFSNG